MSRIRFPHESNAYARLLADAGGVRARCAVISTSEHTAPFNTVSCVSFALPAVAFQGTHDTHHQILLLPASLIPCDNRQYPRGLYFSPLSPACKRVNFVAKKDEKSAPLLMPALPADRFGPFEGALTSFPAATFADQLCRLMEVLMHGWIKSYRPDVSVRPLEGVATRMLIQLLEEKDPYIERMLFNRETHRQLYQALKGTFCAWGRQHGTFLFWKRGAGNRSERLAYQPSASDCNEEFVPVFLRDRAECLRMLKATNIIPGVFLSLFLVSYLPNVPIVGGPKQWLYYRRMIKVCNAIFACRRRLGLSRFMYMCWDQGATEERLGFELPCHGTGHHLSLNPLSGDEARHLLSRTAYLRRHDELPFYG